MADYKFVTIWRFAAPQEQVWDLIFNSEQWPAWWRGVQRVETLRDGDANHVGARHRYTWKSKLPYRLIFEMETTRVEPPTLIEGRAIGELQGTGRWQLSNDGAITTVRYDWQVETTKAWMNLFAPIARPFFSWNHNVIMGWGGEGLARRLGVSLE
ncbi:MAG TPA: SRPBCC family protein [Pyrinomonadaceae bacterium]|jgi:uncharacterized protein YndB with AHSA1/START domain